MCKCISGGNAVWAVTAINLAPASKISSSNFIRPFALCTGLSVCLSVCNMRYCPDKTSLAPSLCECKNKYPMVLEENRSLVAHPPPRAVEVSPVPANTN